VIAISKNMALLTAISVVWVATLALLWLYMTYYLVTPINTVKKSIEEVTLAICRLRFRNLATIAPGA
jgi:hypothetical protein